MGASPPPNALSPREQWLLLCWMVRHPAALIDDTIPSARPRGGWEQCTPAVGRSWAYQLGVLCGLACATLVLAVRRRS